MAQITLDKETFNMSCPSYKYTTLGGWLWLLLYTSLAIGAGGLSIWFWVGSVHQLTNLVTWQEALTLLFGYVALLCLVGITFTLRFLRAIYSGYKAGMIFFQIDQQLRARDLAKENFLSLALVLCSLFLCFCVLLAGLLPEMLLNWIIHLHHSTLLLPGLILLVLLSIAGGVVSLIAAVVLIIGWIGAISTGKRLGMEQVYRLNDRVNFSVDDGILTISYPGVSETLLNLQLLSEEDRKRLLLHLQEYGPLLQTQWLAETEEEARQPVEKPSGNLLLA